MIYTDEMNQTLNTNLAKNLQRLRKLKQWTQRDLGDLLHVDHSMVARWENGKVFPRSKTLQRLAEALEVPVDQLMSETQNGANLANIPDQELAELLGQISVLEQRDLDALKTVLEGMLTRHQLKQMMHKSR